MRKIWCLLTVVLLGTELGIAGAQAGERSNGPPSSWKIYTNARYGFSIRYPPEWHLGEPFPDEAGITMTPPVPKSQFALNGFLNLQEGSSQDGRQTLDEFAAAHHRIIGEYYGKKKLSVLLWQKDHTVTFGGFPAKQLSFSYQDETKTEMIELYIFSLGRNEGRGVRVKFPAASRTTLMPILAEMLKTYQAGRDQNAVSPFVPKDGDRSKGKTP